MITPYGFKWGPLKVERLAHVPDSGYALSIETDYGMVMQVYVSEKGRVIRAYEPYRLEREITSA
jgi:hypothetical protein